MRTNLKSISQKPERLMPWQRVSGDRTRTIGVLNPCYGSSHVIYGLGTTRYAHRTLPTLPLGKLDGKVTFFQFTPLIVDRQLPLVHTWNAVPLNKDFIVSFELELPRYLGGPSDEQVMRGMRLLDSDRCKQILALSQFAYDYAARRFERHGVGHLSEKMQVFRGAVPDPLPSMTARGVARRDAGAAGEPLSAVVIGTQLFRKGGMYAIQAFERLRASGLDVTLTLIGDFEDESYAFGRRGLDAAAWRARAAAHDWIRFVGPVPNAQVFTELMAHDLCIYTSLDESLGWLPIEAGMLGVPVVATAVCAFPELVGHDDGGWLIPLPLREDGRWAGLEVDEPAKGDALAEASDLIVDGIEACLRAVDDDRSLLAKWGAAGRRRAVRHYDMKAAAAELESIYDRVLADF